MTPVVVDADSAGAGVLLDPHYRKGTGREQDADREPAELEGGGDVDVDGDTLCAGGNHASRHFEEDVGLLGRRHARVDLGDRRDGREVRVRGGSFHHFQEPRYMARGADVDVLFFPARRAVTVIQQEV